MVSLERRRRRAPQFSYFYEEPPGRIFDLYRRTYFNITARHLSRILSNGHGSCYRCGKPFRRGDDISNTKRRGRVTRNYHLKCFEELFIDC